MIKAIIAVIIGAVLLIVVMSNVDKATGGGEDPGSSDVDTKYTVSIEGQVNSEGTYYISSGGKLSDLIDAAGGITSNADDRAYNLDYLLKNNLSFYIAPRYDTSETCAQVEITKYNINSAPAEELQKINGVNATVATSIIAYRDNGGRFNRIEDLKEVKGIGSATLTKMRNFVTLK